MFFTLQIVSPAEVEDALEKFLALHPDIDLVGTQVLREQHLLLGVSFKLSARGTWHGQLVHQIGESGHSLDVVSTSRGADPGLLGQAEVGGIVCQKNNVRPVAKKTKKNWHDFSTYRKTKK